MELEVIHKKIVKIREFKVVLDFDLALVKTFKACVLKQAVGRDSARLLKDFILMLTETNQLVLQAAIPSKNYLGRTFSFAFAEQGTEIIY